MERFKLDSNPTGYTFAPHRTGACAKLQGPHAPPRPSVLARVGISGARKENSAIHPSTIVEKKFFPANTDPVRLPTKKCACAKRYALPINPTARKESAQAYPPVRIPTVFSLTLKRAVADPPSAQVVISVSWSTGPVRVSPSV